MCNGRKRKAALVVKQSTTTEKAKDLCDINEIVVFYLFISLHAFDDA